MTSRLARGLKATAIRTAIREFSLDAQPSACASLQMFRGTSLLKGHTDVAPRLNEPATLAHCPPGPVVKPRVQGANIHCSRLGSGKVEAATAPAAAVTAPAELRRAFSATTASTEAASSPDKQTPITKVPGVGLRNAVRLKAKGFSTVEALQQLFVEEHKQRKDEMIKYLQVCWL